MFASVTIKSVALTAVSSQEFLKHCSKSAACVLSTQLDVLP